MSEQVKKDDLREMIREEISAALSPKKLPPGHTKCAKCGEIYRVEYGKCPYCEVAAHDKKKDDEDDDNSITII